MLIAFYNGVTGMVAYQEQLNVVGHNIANVNNVGFKPSRSSFTDLMYTQMNTKVEGENLVGHGVKHQDTDLMMGESGLNQTDNMLDFAIAGKGFFCVQHPDGSKEYTRDGTFAMSVEGNTNYLVASDGSYVLDKSGQKIQITYLRDNPDLTEDEREQLADSNELDYGLLSEKIGLYNFSNPYGLETYEGNRFRETDNSGKAEAIKDTAGSGLLRQGMVEFSGVDLATEMVKMIQAQRAFQLNSRVVKTADAMEDTINGLRQ